MKNKLIIGTVLMLAVSGFVAASPSDITIDDDFFSNDGFFGDDSEDDDFFNDDGDDSFGDSMFDDDFFSDDAGEDETNESEDEAGICVIGEDSPCNSEEYDGDNETEDNRENESEVTEERHVTPAPEPSHVGEDYLSYPNPRNHFLHPPHREGSMKVCKIVLNQNGEVIEGSTLEDVTFSVDTSIGDTVSEYESDSEPVTFDTPIDQVADLIGTSPELREGDGQLDAECAEFHDLPLNQTYTYSQEEITGADSDEVETVGYIEKWDNRRTPLSNVETYGTSDLSDGEVHLAPGNENRHAEVIVVNQLK